MGQVIPLPRPPQPRPLDAERLALMAATRLLLAMRDFEVAMAAYREIAR